MKHKGKSSSHKVEKENKRLPLSFIFSSPSQNKWVSKRKKAALYIRQSIWFYPAIGKLVTFPLDSQRWDTLKISKWQKLPINQQNFTDRLAHVLHFKNRTLSFVEPTLACSKNQSKNSLLLNPSVKMKGLYYKCYWIFCCCFESRFPRMSGDSEWTDFAHTLLLSSSPECSQQEAAWLSYYFQSTVSVRPIDFSELD